MIRVLRIINRFNLGGPIYNASYLSAGLGDEFETLLIGGEHEESEGNAQFIPESLGLNPTIIKNMQRSVSPAKDKKALGEIRAIIKEFKPHILHTHASKAGAIGRRAAKLEGVPVIVHTFHGHVFKGYFGGVKTSLYKLIERRLAKKTDAIIAISKEQKKQLTVEHKIGRPNKFHVIPLGFDLKRFNENKKSKREWMRRSFEIEEDDLVIGIIGRLVPIKNHDLFFKAMEELLDRTKVKITICIVGDGELRENLESKAALLRKKYSVQIKFLGWQKEIDKILAGIDVLALTSLNEGTPVSLIEAQAAGVPVISTNVGGVIDVVDDGNTGVIVNSFDPFVYGKALSELILNKETCAKMTQNGWDFVRQRFSQERLCFDMKELYKKLLKDKGIIE